MAKAAGKMQGVLPVVLTVIAALLRVPIMGFPLQGDEAMNFIWYAFIPWGDLLFKYTDTSQHTLAVALARLSMELFGETEIAYRLPVFLAGVLAVPMLYKVASHLLESKVAALVAAALLAFSFHPLEYSHNARSYSLTVFLSIALLYTAIKLSEGVNRVRWGFGLIVVGLAMILALPTNALFLAAVTIFFVVTRGRNLGSAKMLLSPGFLLDLTPFLILAALSLFYLYTIRHGLMMAPVIFASLGTELNWDKFTRLCYYLAEPWSAWVYLFFIFGLAILARKGRCIPFLMLFLVPIALMLILHVMGPERTHLFWAPFILLGVAAGMVGFVSAVNERLHLRNRVVFPSLLMVTMLVQPVARMNEHYREHFNSVGATIANARQVLDYLSATKSAHRLIVYHDTILTKYIGKFVMENNFSVLRNGGLEDIIFVVPRDIPPQNAPLIGWLYPSTQRISPFPQRSFQLVKEIGNVRIHRFAGKISNLAPTAPNPDFEGIFTPVSNPAFVISQIANLKVTGNFSVSAENHQSEKLIISPSHDFPVNAGTGDNVGLLIYAGKFHLKSKVEIVAGSNTEAFFMNFGKSIFTMEDNKVVWQAINPWDRQHLLDGIFDLYPTSFWEMRMVLYPIVKDSKKFDLTIVLGKGTFDRSGIFDGVQTYLLEP